MQKKKTEAQVTLKDREPQDGDSHPVVALSTTASCVSFY